MARNMQERPLPGKVALVAGGSRGIGAVFAKRLVAPNFDQTLSYCRVTTEVDPKDWTASGAAKVIHFRYRRDEQQPMIRAWPTDSRPSPEMGFIRERSD
jgi:NAD(P)-dependent dehydrogenase (short-subunit alcohol dehydrogenase family)